MPKGRKGRRSSSKRLVKKMKSSCMWGGDSAVTGLSGSGATGYGAAIYGAANAQTTNGMGSNNIKMNDPGLVWKGGQRGGGSFPIPVGATNIAIEPQGATTSTVEIPAKINWTDAQVQQGLDEHQTDTSTDQTSLGGSRGGSVLGAAIVPAALLAANQLYKPSRALKNLKFSRKNGFKKTMKKFRKGKR